MPQLLQNIHEIIEAFGRYASSEGGCTALTRGELKRLLEHEFASVIVKPHDPATVDKVLRLLDEDNTGTVEFQEFLVLVFQVAQACFKTLSETPGGACRYQGSESHHAASSAELGQGQRSGPEVERDGKGAWQHEGNSFTQREQASRGQGRLGTHIQGQDSSSVQVSGHGRWAGSQQQQQTVSQQTHVTGQVEQTPRVEGRRHHQARERSSERQSQTSQQTGKLVTRPATQLHTGASQEVEQDRSSQTGNSSIQTQWSTHGQNRGPESHGQDWSQAHQVVTGGHNQAQAGSYTQTHSQTHTQIVEQGQIAQSGNTSIQTPWSTCGQNRGTENSNQDMGQAQQVVTGGHIQTQAGSSTQTVDWSQTGSQVGAQEQRQTQTQSNRGPGWTQVSPHETGETAPGGRTQTGTGTVTERQELDNSHPGGTGGQGHRVPTVVSEEWVDDHTREVVIRSEDPGRVHSGAPSARS